MTNMNTNNFESLGAHLRNLLTPYTTIIELIDELYDADKNGDMEKFNEIKELIFDTQLNRKENNNNINTFSFVEPMEENNWRDTKLYKMDTLLELIKNNHE